MPRSRNDEISMAALFSTVNDGVAHETLRGILHDFPSSSILITGESCGRPSAMFKLNENDVDPNTSSISFGSLSADAPVLYRWKGGR